MLRMLVAAGATVTLAACGLSVPIGGRPTNHEIVESNPDARRVIFELRKRAPFVIARDISRVEALSDAPGTAYTIGREWLHLHSYRTAEAAAKARTRLVQDPRNAVIQWAGPPHAFHCGRVVALYLGSDAGSLAALSKRCGPAISIRS